MNSPVVVPAPVPHPEGSRRRSGPLPWRRANPVLVAARERLIQVSFALMALIGVGAILGIFAILLINAFHAFRSINLLGFLTGTIWRPEGWGEPVYGILPMFVSSLMVSVLALGLSVPVGIGVASFLAERAPRWLRETVKPVVELMAGVPSVVIGFIGLVITGPLIARIFNIPSGLNAVNAALICAFMALPTIISISEDALRAVPQGHREASLAVGASRLQTLLHVTIPAARPGIVAAVMLGFGRVMGETMAVMMAAGNAPALTASPLDPVMTMTAVIGIELGESVVGSEHYYALFAVGLVLFLITFLTNLGAEVFVRRHRGR